MHLVQSHAASRQRMSVLAEWGGGGSSVAKAAVAHSSGKGYWCLLLSISSMGGRGMLDWGWGDIGKSLPMLFPVPTWVYVLPRVAVSSFCPLELSQSCFHWSVVV